MKSLVAFSALLVAASSVVGCGGNLGNTPPSFPVLTQASVLEHGYPAGDLVYSATFPTNDRLTIVTVRLDIGNTVYASDTWHYKRTAQGRWEPVSPPETAATPNIPEIPATEAVVTKHPDVLQYGWNLSGDVVNGQTYATVRVGGVIHRLSTLPLAYATYLSTDPFVPGWTVAVSPNHKQFLVIGDATSRPSGEQWLPMAVVE